MKKSAHINSKSTVKDFAEKIKPGSMDLNKYYESFVQSSREAFMLINTDGSLIVANNSAMTMTDYESEEITDIHASNLFKGEEYSAWLTGLASSDKNIDVGSLYLKEVKVNICTKHGYKIPGMLNCSPMLDDKGSIQGGVIAASDQTESIFLERALSENEEKLSSISRFANDAILMMDTKGKICFWNKASTRIFGYREDEVYGVDLHKLLVPEKYHKQFYSGFKHFLETGEGNAVNKTMELTAIRKSGEEFPMEISLSSYRIRNKWNAIGIIRDISERKIYENKLIESEVYHRTLIETSPNAIVTTSTEGIITFASNRAYEMFNIPKEVDITNTSLLEWVYHEDHDKVIDRFGGNISGYTKAGSSEYRLLRYDKEIFFGSVSSSPIIDANNQITGLHINIHDIDRSVQMISELKEAKEKAEENDRLKASFIQNISHEIRTPMNALVGFGELLKDPDITKEERKIFSDNIIEGTNQLLSTVTAMVEISNINSGTVKKKVTDIYPSRILQEVNDLFIEKAKEKNLQFKLLIDDKEREIKIVSDKTLLKKALSYIVDNAIKYTLQGIIEMGISITGDNVKFFVRDTGPGIAEEYRDSIFEPFYQIENSLDRKAGGSGLGLSIAKGFVQILGGNIDFISEKGKGTEFYFQMKRKLSDSEFAKKNDSLFLSKETITVLVAEDNNSNYNLIANYLKQSNVKLIRAFNGLEAVTVCETENIDFVLMDLQMPVMNGFEATKKIKTIRSDIQILAQTAYANEKAHAAECGCDGFISKPFSRMQLLNAIREFIPDKL